jgi:SAM-dependent methyltransferase
MRYQRLRLALAIIKSRWYDKALGIQCAGCSPLVTSDISLHKDMHGFESVFYGLLKKTVRYLKLSKDDIFVDLGCGKGRAVFFVAQQQVKKVVGVELDPDLFSIACNNLKNLKKRKSPVELLNIDAVDFDPFESTVFFLSNPFGPTSLKMVLANIKRSLLVNPREIRIVYHFPNFRGILDDQGWLTYDGAIKNNRCLVWRSNEASRSYHEMSKKE